MSKGFRIALLCLVLFLVGSFLVGTYLDITEPARKTNEATSELEEELQEINKNSEAGETEEPVDPFGEAVNAAMAAAEAAQTAKSAGDWNNVSNLWAKAIELMNAVPESSSNYQTAQQKVLEYQPNLDYAQQNQVNSQVPDRISASGAGLGDEKSTFDQKYGQGIDQEIWIRYSNDYLLVTFIEDRAWNIQIQFEATQQNRVSKSEAIRIGESMMPADAIKEGERQESETAYVIRYKSDLLGQVFSADSFTSASGEAEVGIFILILQHEPNNPNQVFGAILGPGDNP
jgi:hypothetical protein